MDPTAADSAQPTNAADAAEARREARRRRILENSSNRLAKIAGREEQPATTTTTSSSTSTTTKLPPAVIHDDPEMERDTFEPQRNDHHQLPFMAFGSASAGAPPAELMDMFASMNGGLGGAGGANPFAMFQGLTNASSLDAPLLTGDLFAGLLGSTANGQAPLQQQQQPAQPVSLIVRLMRSKLHIALIGVLTFLLATNDVMFRSHVFTAFLLWEAVELFVLKPYEKDRSSYVGLVFLIGGIPTEHTSVALRWFATVRRVLKDVAIFVFFFVIAHVLWQRLVIGESLTAILNVAEATVETMSEAQFVRSQTRPVVDVEPDMEFEF